MLAKILYERGMLANALKITKNKKLTNTKFFTHPPPKLCPSKYHAIKNEKKNKLANSLY